MFFGKLGNGLIDESDFKVLMIENFIVKVLFVGEIDIQTRYGGKSFWRRPGLRQNVAFT